MKESFTPFPFFLYGIQERKNTLAETWIWLRSGKQRGRVGRRWPRTQHGAIKWGGKSYKSWAPPQHLSPVGLLAGRYPVCATPLFSEAPLCPSLHSCPLAAGAIATSLQLEGPPLTLPILTSTFQTRVFLPSKCNSLRMGVEYLLLWCFSERGCKPSVAAVPGCLLETQNLQPHCTPSSRVPGGAAQGSVLANLPGGLMAALCKSTTRWYRPECLLCTVVVQWTSADLNIFARSQYGASPQRPGSRDHIFLPLYCCSPSSSHSAWQCIY